MFLCWVYLGVNIFEHYGINNSLSIAVPTYNICLQLFNFPRAYMVAFIMLSLHNVNKVSDG